MMYWHDFHHQDRDGDVEKLYQEISQLNNDLSDMENDVREKVGVSSLIFVDCLYVQI